MFSRLIGIYALLVGQSIGDDDCGISVDYVGNSGQFKLESDCTSEFLKLKMESLIEIDESGESTNNKVSSFANQDYEWITQDDDDTTYQGLSAVVNTYSSELSVDSSSVGFNLTTILFLSNGTIDVYGESEYVNDKSLKWTIEINDWPFLSNNNSLEICMNVGHGGSSGDSSSGSSSGDDNSDDSNEYYNATDSSSSSSSDSMEYNMTNSTNDRRLLSSTSSSSTFGDFNLIVPLSVELDGETVDGVSFMQVENNYNDSDSDDSNDDDASVSFCWIFDSFDNRLAYDPVVIYQDTSPQDTPTTTMNIRNVMSSTNNIDNEQSDHGNIKQLNLFLFALLVLVTFLY